MKTTKRIFSLLLAVVMSIVLFSTAIFAGIEGEEQGEDLSGDIIISSEEETTLEENDTPVFDTIEDEDKRVGEDECVEEDENNYEYESEFESSEEIEEIEEIVPVVSVNIQSLLQMYNAVGDTIESAFIGGNTPEVGSLNDWALFSLARAGRNVSDDYVAGLVNYINERGGALHTNAYTYTEYSRVILALTAAGYDPATIADYDVFRGLVNYILVVRQGINGAAYALLALDSHSYSSVIRNKLVSYIKGAVLSDGGWAYSGTTSEIDMTAIVIQALAPYYQTDGEVKALVDNALLFLKQHQLSDGSYAAITSSTDGTSESTAQVIVALTSLGIDPAGFCVSERNASPSILDGLALFYTNGRFKHVLSGTANVLATNQGYYALASYFRFLEGKTSLYNMNDVTLKKSLIEEPVEEIFFGKSLSLYESGEIELNFYAGICEGTDINSVSVKADTLGKTATKLSDYAFAGSKTIVDDFGREVNYNIYRITVPVKPVSLTDKITVQLLKDGKETECLAESSVIEYAQDILQETQYEKERPVVKSLLNFGAAAQVYFKVNTNNLANSILSKEDINFTPESVDGFEIQKNGKCEGVEYYGSSLILKSDVMIRHYFVISNDEKNNLKFSVDGEIVETVSKDNLYYIDINGVGYNKLGANHRVIISNKITGSKLIIDYSALSYVTSARLNQSTDRDLIRLVNCIRKIEKECYKYS